MRKRCVHRCGCRSCVRASGSAGALRRPSEDFNVVGAQQVDEDGGVAGAGGRDEDVAGAAAAGTTGRMRWSEDTEGQVLGDGWSGKRWQEKGPGAHFADAGQKAA